MWDEAKVDHFRKDPCFGCRPCLTFSAAQSSRKIDPSRQAGTADGGGHQGYLVLVILPPVVQVKNMTAELPDERNFALFGKTLFSPSAPLYIRRRTVSLNASPKWLSNMQSDSTETFSLRGKPLACMAPVSVRRSEVEREGYPHYSLNALIQARRLRTQLLLLHLLFNLPCFSSSSRVF
jgi:hypothetical protein